MTYLLGVDGGNSKTIAVVGDDGGQILGLARAGSSNHQGLGLTEAMDRIRGAALAAMRMAGVEPEQVAGAYCCLAGADLPSDFALLRPALRDLGLAQDIDLNNDSIASLRAGTDNPNAVCVALGAGTVAVGRNAAGQEIRLPALGWISGDWGGGGDLAREAIWYTVRMHDGRGEPTMLHDMVLRALDVPDGDVLIERLYHRQIGHDTIVHLAPLVFEAAEAGDRVARDLIERSGVEVAVTARALLRRLGLIEIPADVVLGGSIFRGQGPLLIDTVRARLSEFAPLARMILLDVDPVLGSFFCAMDLLDIRVDEQVRRKAKETYMNLSTRMVREVALR